jgi:hypothetical protein
VNVDESSASYHAMAGMVFRILPWLPVSGTGVTGGFRIRN